MMNIAHSTDVFLIYADMVTCGETHLSAYGEKYYCVYAASKDGQDISFTYISCFHSMSYCLHVYHTP